jgi:hypothetical protein
MKRAVVCGLALSVLGAAAPLLAAEKFYVPIVEPLAADGTRLSTEVTISNFDLVGREYKANFRANETGAARGLSSVVAADRAEVLDKMAPAGETGLLEIEAGSELLVDAWIKSVDPRTRRTFYSGVPVITPWNRYAAGASAYVNELGAGVDLSEFGLINLGLEKSVCDVEFLGANGSLNRGVSVDLDAVSMRRFEDGLGLRAEKATGARVSCDQPFYAYALTSDPETSQVSFVSPATEVMPATKAKAPKAAVTFERKGTYHVATQASPKGVIRIPVPTELGTGSVTVEFSVTLGPWTKRNPAGAHGLMWLHRGKFRSNTVGNINALGPKKNFFKINQNIDLARGNVTNSKAGVPWETGKTYRVRLVYDAANKTVRTTLSDLNGTVIKTLLMNATAQNRLLRIQSTGLIAEFGHWTNQHAPEVPSIGFKYHDFSIVMVPR